MMLRQLSLSLLLLAAPSLLFGADNAGFFETKVSPLLAQRCFECHSHEKKIKGGLALDSRNGWAKGGDSGPALTPGKPEESLLVKAISYTDKDLSMPPKAKLSDAEIGVLTQWVRIGAPDPRAAIAPKSQGLSFEERCKLWSFQPIRNPAAPPVRDSSWPRNELDRFVLARLEREGLAPNGEAPPRALLRRVYFDLIGLPPSFEEIEAFAQAPTRAAFSRIVDDLLSRPEYGQRWGRHWLDVARYADTIEQSVDGERRIPFAYTYRDYVIEAFNRDKPFDRFVIEQVAADRLPDATKEDLRALGFLGVGRRFRSNAEGANLVIDDRIDVIGRGFLGLTLACARCHDHKFDPIPTKDYYSLFGILGSVREPMDLPEVRRIGDEAAVAKYLEQRAAIFHEYEAHLDDCLAKANQHFREMATEYLQYLVRSSPNHRTTEGFIPLDTPRGLLRPQAPARWEALLRQCAARGEPFFKLWRQLMPLPRDRFAEESARVIGGVAEHSEGCHPAVVAAFRGQRPATMLEVAGIYGQIIATALKDDSAEGRSIVDLVFGPSSPLPARRDEIAEDLARFITEHQLVDRASGEKNDKILEKLTALESTAPIERAMVLQAAVPPLDPHILIRGDAKQPGAATPRRFLTALARVDDRAYEDDGRLQLAQAIVNPNNPLTARVIVNRVWQHHFGVGLVGSSDNFGAMGERPSHPELLDHLATWFMQHGWSLKALHRYILTSATWQQSSALQAAGESQDPGNRLLWRMSPRRLEFEPLRDSLLRVAGRLDRGLGGHSALLSDRNVRRAVYGYTDRFRIPALLRNFDVANPDTSISRRSETLVPLQALYLLNSSFVRQQADAVMAQPECRDAATAPDRVKRIFQLVLSRLPSDDEMEAGLAYAGAAPLDHAGGKLWGSFVQALLVSNEFVFVD